jgi:hypothetical protein
MKETHHIHIFSTDIQGLCPNCALSKTLDNLDGISHWSLDTEDKDRVLRVVSPSMDAAQIALLVQNHGYRCQELQ